MNNDELISGFVDDGYYEKPVNDLSDNYIMRREVASHGFNQLTKACRHGKWYMLKGLKPEYRAIPLFQQMLDKEYELHKNLKHPNIAECFGMEEIDDLGPCLILEFVQGHSLRNYITEGQYMPVNTYLDRSVRIVREIADAMSYFHARQIVHRDLKPENILITDNGNNPKVIDFGYADSDLFALLKQPAGTAHYIAPEQLERGQADVRSDIYSFGVILKEIFADKRLGAKGKVYLRVSKQCTMPIDRRIQSVDALCRQLTSAEHYRPWWRTWWMPLLVVLLIIQVALVLHLRQDRITYVEGTAIPVSEVDSLTVGYTIEQRNALIRGLQSFAKNRGHIDEQIQHSLQERDQFVKDFTPDSIVRMSAFDYDLNNAQSFCLKLRNQMPMLGDMLPYPPSVCFGKNLEGDSLRTSCREIARVIAYGYSQSHNFPHENLHPGPLRRKLLSVYYPDRYLSILDEFQMEMIIEQLLPDASMRYRFSPSYNKEGANATLLKVRDHFPMFSDMSVCEYSYFLTHYFPISQ